MNEWARENWQLFSRHNYFSANGSFLAVVYAAPLVVNALLVLINLVLETGRMMVLVKRQELRHKRRREALDRKKNQ